MPTLCKRKEILQRGFLDRDVEGHGTVLADPVDDRDFRLGVVDSRSDCAIVGCHRRDARNTGEREFSFNEDDEVTGVYSE